MKAENKYRGIPFWCWNGKLEKQEIIRQVHILKEMGFGGFFMHSRTGLVTEYLGDEWFELIRTATQEAEKLGMSAWLYDEDRWPSGTAGGEVTKNPEFQMKSISVYDENAVPEEGVYIAGELGKFAILLNDRNEMIDYYPVDSSSVVKEGYTVKKFLIEHMKPQDFYNGYTYLDTLNRDATDAFIRATHALYKEKCGDLFGKTLLGVFTDEPHRGSLLNGFGLNNKNSLNMMPYSYGLYDKFRQLCKEELADKLPELYYKRADSKINRTMYYYIESLEQLFLENFAKPYHQWCEENRLILTGHILHEDSLAIQTLFQGSVQRFYEHMGYPGVDILTEGNRAYWVAKQVQSVARQLGKEFVLSELYGCTGWQFNFRSHRDVGAWQTLLGINMRCHHLSWYTMEGEAKRDYPASIFYQSGWYRDYAYIEDYFARLGEITSKGCPLCDTLVINPVESMWLYPRAKWEKNCFELQLPECIRLEESYTKLFQILTTGQVDFDYGDEDILARHYKIVTENGKPMLAVGRSRYSTVVVSGMDTVRSSTLNILQNFIDAGGDVLFVGDMPFCIDAKESALPAELIDGCSRIALERDAVLGYLSSHRFFEINSSEIITTVRKENDRYYLVCLNEDRDNAKENLTLRLAKPYHIEEIYLDRDLECGIAEHSASIPVRFEAGECRVFRVYERGQLLPVRQNIDAKEEILLQGPFSYTLNEPNVLPLDLATCFLDGEEFGSEGEILRTDREIRLKLGLPLRGGEMIQPWFRDKYGIAGTDSGSHTIILKYRFNVEHIPESNLNFVIEQSERWKISVNGQTLSNRGNGHWIDPCFDRLDLPVSYLKTGENELALAAEYTDSLNLECVYIMGQFGVSLDGRKASICKLPEKLSVGDITYQGLPFYSGTVTYRTGIGDRRLSVKLGGCYGAVGKARGSENGEYIAFAPYESGVFDCDGELKIDVILTRRNTFGPLHFPPVLASAYGPDTFVIGGPGYTEQFCLIPQGLMENPIVKIY